ncbi:hypothetical protein AYO44_14095 [Planctomycetaceae bacterium SCGC AG-212-F19]|nr:hypothetical protein AYO44_14095 [Planctomycetaceae bacterium SCGC AG-212-F19]
MIVSAKLTPKTSGADRRKSRRFACRLEAICQLPGVAARAPIVDISAAGIGLLLDRELEPGSIVQLQLRTPRGTQTLPMEVIHVAPAGPGCWLIGGAFETDLDPADFRDWVF